MVAPFRPTALPGTLRTRVPPTLPTPSMTPLMTPFTIKIRENGSLFITAEDAANLLLTDHTGAPLALPAGKAISLCRCGASKRKPFCDSSHKAIEFDGTLAPPTAPLAPVPGGIAPDRITPDGIAAGGVAPDGIAAGGIAPDRSAPGAIAPGGTAAGGAAPGGIAPAGTAPGGTAAGGSVTT